MMDKGQAGFYFRDDALHRLACLVLPDFFRFIKECQMEDEDALQGNPEFPYR